MQAYRRADGWAGLMVMTALIALAAKADFKVTEVSPSISDDSLTLSGALDLSLNARVEEALSKGIPIEVIIDIGLYRARPIIWDRRVQHWVSRRRISYHALSRQFLVTGHRPDSELVESFTSLQPALANMGSLEQLTLPLAHQPVDENEYYVRVRASLDIESLPAPLRPVAHTSIAWRLNSGWTEWTVPR
ncbi:MAG: DUF4390 domain-containing protein [Acidiferrobacterales bacterium]